MADTFKNFAELAAVYTEGTDFIVSGENLRDDIGITAYHGGGIEIGTTELLRSVRSLKSDWSWYSFEALLSSGNSVLHITSTNYDEPRGLTFVKRLNRIVSLHGAAGDTPITYIGGRDVVMRNFIWKALEDRGFTVELADGGIAGIEPDNFINRTKSGEGVQLELSTQQRKNLFVGGDWSRSKRVDPANWSQDMVNYTAAIIEGTEKALALKVLGQGSISLVNLNDTLSGGSPPANPSEGFLWIDSSGSKKMLKQWTSGAWVELGELDPELSGSLADINQTINDMISDSVIDYQERQQQNDMITEVIGYLKGDTTQTMPTVSYLDSNNKGEFYTVRKSAQMAGVSTDDPKYTDVATKYGDLKAYLDGLQPIKIWDLSLANKDINITVEKNTLRTKWLQYKLAVAALNEAIAAKLKENVDNVWIGARNFIRNSTFNLTSNDGSLASWINVNSRWVIDPPESDKPDSSILRATATGNTTDANYYLQSNQFNAKIGDIFTFSLDFKVEDVAAWDGQQVPFIMEFYDGTARAQYLYGTLDRMKITNMQSNVWYRGSYTINVTAPNIIYGRIKVILFRNGSLSIREVQVERGNRMTDWKAAPEDMIAQVSVVEERLATIEQSTSDDAIVNKVIGSTQYQADLEGKADADALGNYATNDKLDEALTGVGNDLNNAIEGIDFSPYIKSSELEQTMDALTAKFEKSGGINMIKNSVGFASTDNWKVTTGSVQSLQNTELAALGFGSGFYSPSGSSIIMTQDVYTTIGQVYTFTLYLKKMSNSGTSSHAGVDLLDQAGSALTWMGRGSNQGVTNGFEKFTYTFTALTSTHRIRITIGTGTEAVLSGLMFNIGEVPLQWSLANGELYNTNVIANENGLKVAKVENGTQIGYTVIKSDQVASYYDVDNNGTIDETPNSVDEVFRVDKDEFVQKKAVVKEEITMGGIKVVKIDSTTTKGWAFVSNAE